MTEHLCLACKKPIVGKLRESAAKVAARKYCSRACHAASHHLPVMLRACPVCSKTIERRRYPKRGWYESPAEYDRRITCSRACAHIALRERSAKVAKPPKQKWVAPPPPPQGYCQHCRKQFPAKRSNEAYDSYARRKFCSPKCANVHRTMDSRLRWNARFESTQPNIRETIPAATEAEWLRLNNGPTICPVRFAAPIEHRLQIYSKAARARYVP